MPVVDDNPDRAVLGDPYDKSQHPGRHGKPVRCWTFAQSQRDLYRPALGRRQDRNAVEQGPEHLPQPGERQAALILRAARPQQPAATRRGRNAEVPK